MYDLEFLILDELFNGFDFVGWYEMIKVFKEWVVFGKSFLLVSYFLYEVEVVNLKFFLVLGGCLFVFGFLKEVCELLVDLFNEVSIRVGDFKWLVFELCWLVDVFLVWIDEVRSELIVVIMSMVRLSEWFFKILVENEYEVIELSMVNGLL